MADLHFFPRVGERALIVGQTGSGKTWFAKWMVERLGRPTIIYDTKIDKTFERLGGAAIFEDHAHAYKHVKKEGGVAIFRPPLEVLNDPNALDEYLLAHYDKAKGVQAYIDEIYQFHEGFRAGQGLTGLLTRGRSRKITTIMSTQRPSYLSRFCLTESQKFYLFRLIDKKDRLRLQDVVPEFSKIPSPPKFHSYFYDTELDAAVPVLPVSFTPERAEKEMKWV